ncbi:MAG: alpha-glucosidase/alpha-galactosidase [Clostridia bacterium]|nr:alpha-glucosidase/alpha-galactosidase [Clostridia bacterium]
MKYIGNKVKDVKIAYIGGGSRGWAWGLMSDLVACEDVSGVVSLYDIDREAAEHNKIIGEKYNLAEGAKSHWEYEVAETLESALKGANFVVISILPGTFDEMASDVHLPEQYGIYQAVGDTVGVGGIIRALRTIPMIEKIGLAVKEVCPDAWVINYTNPMTMCVKTLYRVFPQIKAFGCCHEVFGTQSLLIKILDKLYGVEGVKREDIKVNVVGVNHFTWLTSAYYRNIDLFEVYGQFVDKYYQTGYEERFDENWLNSCWRKAERVKMDLFKRYGYIAAAGDRHLAEFCPANWYLNDRECVEFWKFALTTVDWRKKDLKERLECSEKFRSGEETVTLRETGEDGVNQIRALLGLHDMTTNVNLPNVGQIPNLPLGAVVETNASFRANEVKPLVAGNIPTEIYSLIARIVGEQEALDQAAAARDLEKAFAVFANDPQMRLPLCQARELFDKMVGNTKEYLTEYFH